MKANKIIAVIFMAALGFYSPKFAHGQANNSYSKVLSNTQQQRVYLFQTQDFLMKTLFKLI